MADATVLATIKLFGPYNWIGLTTWGSFQIAALAVSVIAATIPRGQIYGGFKHIAGPSPQMLTAIWGLLYIMLAAPLYLVWTWPVRYVLDEATGDVSIIDWAGTVTNTQAMYLHVIFGLHVGAMLVCSTYCGIAALADSVLVHRALLFLAMGAAASVCALMYLIWWVPALVYTPFPVWLLYLLYLSVSRSHDPTPRGYPGYYPQGPNY